MVKSFQFTLGKKLFLFSFVCILAVVAACSVYVWYDSRQNVMERESHNAKMLVRLLRVKLDKLTQDVFLRLHQPYTGSNEWERITLFNLLDAWRNNQPVDPESAQFAQYNLNQAAGNGVENVYAFPVGYSDQLLLRNADTPEGFPDSLPSGGVTLRPDGEQLVEQALKANGKAVYSISPPGGLFHDVPELKGPNKERYVIGALALRNPDDPSLDWIVIMEFKWDIFYNIVADMDELDQQRVAILDGEDRVVFSPQGQPVGKPLLLGETAIKGATNSNQGSIATLTETAEGSEYLIASEVSSKNKWKVILYNDVQMILTTDTGTYLIVGAVALALIAFVATEIAVFTRSNISRPIQLLSNAMNSLGTEEQQLERVPVTTTDEIGELAKAMNFTVSLIEQVNADAVAISNQKRSIQNLLDLSGEGFVSFGPDLRIHSEYSAECNRIFGKEIAGEYWPTLIFGEEANVYDSIFKEIFNKDKMQAEMYISLLPTEWKRGTYIFELEYKMITRDRQKAMMVIVTDVTQQRKLEEKLKSESKVLKMIVNVLPNKEDFVQSIKDFERFYGEELQEMYESGEPVESVKEIAYRRIHTFKGTFAQFGLITVVEQLHALESQLHDLELEDKELAPLQAFLDQVNWATMLDSDKFLLTDILGDGFFVGSRRLMIDIEQYEQMQQRIIEQLPAVESELVKRELKSLQLKPFRDLLQSYPTYVLELSERFEKFIAPFDVEGGEFLVDTDVYRPFAKSLIHVFRNIVDHGIECPDDRLELGKAERGHIRFAVERSEDEGMLTITIADDGNGIDPIRIRDKAIDKGIASEEELMSWSDNQLIDLIFHDGFSTKETVSTMSGRGVGMSAVKMETRDLGGSLQVTTKVGSGTTFIWRLPMFKG